MISKALHLMRLRVLYILMTALLFKNPSCPIPGFTSTYTAQMVPTVVINLDLYNTILEFSHLLVCCMPASGKFNSFNMSYPKSVHVLYIRVARREYSISCSLA